MQEVIRKPAASRWWPVAPALGMLGLLGLAAGGVAAAPDSGRPKAAAPDAGELATTAAPPPPHHPAEGLLVPPSEATVELFLDLPAGSELKDKLLISGASNQDAAEAARLVSNEALDDAKVAILLGRRLSPEERRLERLTIEATRSMRLIVGRDRKGRLRLVREFVAGDATPRKFSGRVGASLFWSLRAAGVSPETAAEYLEALSTRPKIAGRLHPHDRFELVVDHWRSGRGESRPGPLLYAGLFRASGKPLHLVRWTVGGSTGWFEPDKAHQPGPGLGRPVTGRISSRFGHRRHPILRIGRFHEGVDFSASKGTPVVASADGAVVAAGWNGGHGRQVRIAHAGGISTSYSHLSRITAEPGARIRRGQVVGFVGSSGFSTGPHLHYEVRRHGRAVDPLGLQHSVAGTIGPSELAALQARLRQLRSI